MRHRRAISLAIVGLFIFNLTFAIPRPVYAGDTTGWQIVAGVLGAGYLYGGYAGTKQREETNRYGLGLQRDVEMARIHANYAKVAASAHGGSGTTNVSSPWGAWKGESSVAQDNYGGRSYTDVQRGTSTHREIEPLPSPPAPSKKVFEKKERKPSSPMPTAKQQPAVRHADFVPGRDDATIQTLEYVYNNSDKLSVQERIAVSLYLDGLKNPGKYGRGTFEDYRWDAARAIDKVL